MNSFHKRLLVVATIVLLAALAALGSFLLYLEVSGRSTSLYEVDDYSPPPPHPFPSSSSSSSSGDPSVLPHKKIEPISRLSRLLHSLNQVVLRVVMPVAAIVFLAVYAHFNPGLMPTYVQGFMLVMAAVVVAVCNFRMGSFFKPAPDVAVEDALEALRTDNRSFFYDFPLERVSADRFSQLVLLFLSLVPLKTDMGRVDNLASWAPPTVSPTVSPTIGEALVSATSPYLPLWYSASEFEVAGRGKSAGHSSVSVLRSDELRNASPLPEGLAVQQFGDDSVGISQDGRVLALADGVSGSIRPEHAAFASYAAVLMSLVMVQKRDGQSILEYGTPLVRLISKFLKRIHCGGSTTLTVAQVTEAGQLHVLHLGDSTCMVLRGDQVVFSTQSRQTFFNCPHQVCSRHFDLPVGYEFALQDGDTILLMSDGAADNLWPGDIAKLRWAGQIAAKAVEVFLDKLTTAIPFNLSRDYNHIPGKADDVSVLSFVYKENK